MKVTLEFDFDGIPDGETVAPMQQEMWRHIQASDLCAALYNIHREAMKGNAVSFEYVQRQLDQCGIDFERIWT